MTLTVDNPILNSPYREPERYWLYDAAGMPRVENGRRPAGYYFRARARANERQLSMLSDEQLVGAYARTDYMGFAIPYTFAGAGHNFFPDFLVRLANGATLVLEVKGFEDEQDRAKYAAARRWCEAVSNWGQMGRWLFDHCGGPGSVKAVLARHSLAVASEATNG